MGIGAEGAACCRTVQNVTLLDFEQMGDAVIFVQALAEFGALPCRELLLICRIVRITFGVAAVERALVGGRERPVIFQASG